MGISLSRTWHVFVMDLVARLPSKRCNSAAGLCQPPSGMKAVYRARASTFLPWLPPRIWDTFGHSTHIKKKTVKKTGPAWEKHKLLCWRTKTWLRSLAVLGRFCWNVSLKKKQKKKQLTGYGALTHTHSQLNHPPRSSLFMYV